MPSEVAHVFARPADHMKRFGSGCEFVGRFVAPVGFCRPPRQAVALRDHSLQLLLEGKEWAAEVRFQNAEQIPTQKSFATIVG